MNYWPSTFGLPPAISGHNNYWWWGHHRAPHDSTTIAEGLPRDRLTLFYRASPMCAGVA